MGPSMYTAFLVLAIIAIAIQTLILLNALFGPGLAYRIDRRPEHPIDSPEFADLLGTLTDAHLRPDNLVEVLANGELFFPAILEAIRGASKSVHIEAYIFQRGDIAAQYRDALTERARAGVDVKLVLDYIGSFGTPRSWFHDTIEAGGRVEWYNSPGLRALAMLNNRTHRELTIVDGAIGFIGGAGIADNWYHGKGKNPRWRDTVVRVEGPAVANLQAAFAENWLRSAGEIMTRGYGAQPAADGATQAMVVNSTPAAGSTRARILFQTLIASAQRTIHITSPYFLPDA